MKSFKPTKRYMAAYGALVGDGDAPKPRKTRKKPSKDEENDQIKLTNWMKSKNILFTASANGGKRHVAEGAKLKRMGVSAGYPDVPIEQARKGYHGLRIELKRASATMKDVRPEQLWWNKRLNEEGFLAVFCFGFEQAKKVVMDYFGMEE